MNEFITKAYPQAEGFVISNPADRYYLAGFFTPDSLMLYSDDPVLVTDSRYAVAAKAATCRVSIAGGYLNEVIKSAKEQGLRVLGYQPDFLSAGEYVALKDAGFDLIPVGGIFRELRSVKSEKEIAMIQAAQDITDKAFADLLDYIKPGVTEKELRARLEFLMFSYGADGLAFDTIVASGANGAKPHAVPSDKKVEKGEFITFDFGARLNGYDSDMTRTVALGEISPEMERIYQAVLEAHEAGMAILKPGLVCKEADLAAREVLKKYDLEQYFTHSLGHGVGIEIHESPNLNSRCETVLRPGHIVTVEPGVYIEGFCGVRTENMVVLTENGHKSLTGTDKKLIKL